jgi:hypothetical protein
MADEEMAEEEEMTGDMTAADTDILTTLISVVESGEQYTCTLVDNNAEPGEPTEMTLALEGEGNVRMEASTAEADVRMLSVDGSVYIWNNSAQEEGGLLITKECADRVNEELGQDSSGDILKNLRTELEDEGEDVSGEITCTPSSDADFTPPADIEFIDQCELFDSLNIQAPQQ